MSGDGWWKRWDKKSKKIITKHCLFGQAWRFLLLAELECSPHCYFLGSTQQLGPGREKQNSWIISHDWRVFRLICRFGQLTSRVGHQTFCLIHAGTILSMDSLKINWSWNEWVCIWKLKGMCSIWLQKVINTFGSISSTLLASDISDDQTGDASTSSNYLLTTLLTLLSWLICISIH